MNQDGATSLTHAASEGHLSTVEYLVERGANIEAKTCVNVIIIDAKPHVYIYD